MKLNAARDLFSRRAAGVTPRDIETCHSAHRERERSSVTISLELDAGLLYHLAPVGDLTADARREIGRAACDDLDTLADENLAHSRHVQHSCGVLADFPDDLGGRAGGREQTVPDDGL